MDNQQFKIIEKLLKKEKEEKKKKKKTEQELFEKPKKYKNINR